MSQCAAVIVAAGRSQRLGFDKILTPLCGIPVIRYSVQAFAESGCVQKIIIVTRPDLFESMRQSLAGIEFDWELVEGGVERQDSVMKGVDHLEDAFDFVAVHDAARPLVTATSIARMMEMALVHGTCVRARRATDTVKQANTDGIVKNTLDRNQIWLMQTPQIFKTEWLRQAYHLVHSKGAMVTDDAAALEFMGREVKLIEIQEPNVKITRKEDWEWMEYYLNQQEILQLRAKLHQLSNRLSPLLAYPDLAISSLSDAPKAEEYLKKMILASHEVQEQLAELQKVIEKLPQPEKLD